MYVLCSFSNLTLNCLLFFQLNPSLCLSMCQLFHAQSVGSEFTIRVRSDALVLFTLAKQRAQNVQREREGRKVRYGWLNWPLYANAADHSIYQARRCLRLASLWLSTLCKQNALKSPGPHSMSSSSSSSRLCNGNENETDKKEPRKTERDGAKQI